MQEEEAGHKVAHGSSVCRAFTTGYKFKLAEKHPLDAMNGNYILTAIQHIASVGETYRDGEDGGSESFYSNHFTCIPAEVAFRPAAPHTETVRAGIADRSRRGQEFRKTRTGDDEGAATAKRSRSILRPGHRPVPLGPRRKCSCWVRVSQEWAGPRVGNHHHSARWPGSYRKFSRRRSGPPIITGRVYNDETVPYPLPDNHTRSTFKTRSSKGGSADNYNELRFEDKRGSEQIFVRGEKDLTPG